MSIDGIRAVDKEPLAAVDYLFGMSTVTGQRVGPRPISAMSVAQQITAFLPFGNIKAYSTVSSMNADTQPVAGTLAYAEGKTYRKAAESGSPGWELFLDYIPGTQVVRATVTGGTANEVVATSATPVSTAAYQQLINIGPFGAANSGAMTVTINGVTRALLTNTGQPIPSGYITKDSSALVVIDSDGHCRLFSYGDASAIQAIVEDLLVQTQAARDAALAAASSVIPNVFATKAAAETYAPLVAPTFINTAFFDTNQVPGSGARYKNNGTSTGDLVITLSDGVTEVGYDIHEARPAIASYGAVDTVDDRQTILDAFSGVPAGGGITLPDGVRLKFQNGVGIGASLAAKRANAVANGGLRAVEIATDDFVFECNGVVRGLSALDDVLRFSGDRVRLAGRGRIENTSGDFNAANSTDPTVQWRPTLVKMTGDNCEASGGLTFRNHPTYGLWMAGNKAKVRGVTFEGGPGEHEAGEFTVQMGLFMGELTADRFGSIATGNHFQRYAGGAAYSAIFNTCRDAIISENHIENMLEHGIYSYGDGCAISRNVVDDNLGEMVAGAIQCFSQDTSILENHLRGHNNRIDIQRASGTKVISNIGGYLTLRTYHADTSSTVLDNIEIGSNTFVAPVGQFWPIDINVGQPLDNLHIHDNNTDGGGDDFGAERGLISVNISSAASRTGRSARIANNQTSGGGTYPILLRRLSWSEVKGNKATNGAKPQFIRMFGCDNINAEGNSATDLLDLGVGSRVLTTAVYASTSDGNTNIRARENNISRPAAGTTGVVILPTGDQGEGNTVNNGSLKGQFTMPAAESHAVTVNAIRDGAKANITPVNAAAWTLQAGANRIAATVDAANTRFTLASGASAATGSEIFNYEIVQ